jgi:hypothetical protein
VNFLFAGNAAGELIGFITGLYNCYTSLRNLVAVSSQKVENSMKMRVFTHLK